MMILCMVYIQCLWVLVYNIHDDDMHTYSILAVLNTIHDDIMQYTYGDKRVLVYTIHDDIIQYTYSVWVLVYP
jgi:hypothetical protein